MTSMPFANMPADEFDEFPESDERAVILGALRAEEVAEQSIGWDNTGPVVFQFVTRPGEESDPVAFFHPMDVDPAIPVVPQLLQGAVNLRTDRRLRRNLGREDTVHLGVGFICEANFVLSKVRVRQVAGVFHDGQPFVVKRIRGQEPTVDLREVPIRGAGGDLFAALRQLNEAFARTHWRHTRRSA